MTTTPLTDEVLVFTVRADWAHFRKVSGNISRLTYKIPPRTTICGMLAAIVGVERDGYYDTLDRDTTAIAVEPQSPLETVTIPENIIGTNDEENMQTLNNLGGGPELHIPDPTENRKQRVFEFLRNPEYRLHVSIADDEFRDDLKTHLERGTSTYTPSLGLSECLASVSYDGTATPTELPSDEVSEVDTPVIGSDAVKPTTGPSGTVVTERMPGDMAVAEGTTGKQQRTTTEFVDLAIATHGPCPVIGSRLNAPVYESNGATVQFL